MIEEFAGTERFRVIRPLGKGGMGAVYEAHDRAHDERVALKTLRHTNAQYLYFLKNEFRILQGLHHPNLIRLGELIEDHGRWFFTMELVPGTDFLGYVRGPRPRSARPAAIAEAQTLAMPASGPPRAVAESPAPTGSGSGAHPLASVATLASEGAPPRRRPGWFDPVRLRAALVGAVDGLAALHEAGLVHRDVKPSNLMVTEAGRVVVLDFGLVLVQRHRTPSFNDALQLMGTPGYMAPEQYLAGEISAATDWYSLGATLYEALTGRLPYEGTLVQILEAATAESAAPPSSMVEGVPPDIDELCMAMLASDPADRPDEAQIRQVLGERRVSSQPVWVDRPSSAAFIGRDAELEALRRALGRMRVGEPVAVLVEGVSGIGKSALVEAFLTGLESGDVTVLRGRCYERESVPYKGFDSLIDDLSAYLGSLPRERRRALMPERADALTRLFPVLGNGTGNPAADELSPAELRDLGFRALKALLGRIAAATELVLYIDDVQWGDVDSAALLQEMRPPDAPRMLVLGTCRSGEHTGRLARELASRAERVPLEPLSPGESRALVAGLAEDAGPELTALASQISLEAKGSPFFLGEIVRYFAAHGGVDSLSQGEAPLMARVLDERIAQLPEAAAQMLSVLAVFGRPVDPRLAVEAAGLERAAGRRALEDLDARRMARSAGRGNVEVAHDRLREAVLRRIDGDASRAIYDRVVASLDRGGSANASVLGIDFVARHDPARALAYARAAAEQAERALAFDRAQALYELGESLAEGQAQRELRRRRADVMRHAGFTADAARLYHALAKGEPAEPARELKRLAADSLLRAGHIQDGLAGYVEVARELGIDLERGRLGAVGAVVRNRLRLALRGRRWRSVDAAACEPGVLAELDSLFRAGTALGMVDHLRGSVLHTEYLLRALRLGEPQRVCRGLAAEVVFLAAMGGRQLRRARRLAADVMLLAEKLDDRYLVAGAYLCQANVLLFSGEYPKAGESFRAARGHFERCADAAWERTAASYWYLLVAASCGDFDTLAASVPKELEAAARRDDRHASGVFRGHPTVWLKLRDDRPQEVDAELELAVAGWPAKGAYQVHYIAHVGRAMARRYAGDSRGALAALDDANPIARALFIHHMPFIYSEVHKLRGQAAIALGDRRLARACARRLERFGASIARAYASSMRAALALGAGRGDAARARLLESIKLFDAAGAAHDAAAHRYRAGGLIGGARGAQLMGEALQWFESRRVVSPPRMIEYLAPGLVGTGEPRRELVGRAVAGPGPRLRR